MIRVFHHRTHHSDVLIHSTNTAMFLVLDLNDNAPMFGQPSYSFNIAENTDQLVGVGVSATDMDLGVNREITYYITDGNQDYTFILGRNNGMRAILDVWEWILVELVLDHMIMH